MAQDALKLFVGGLPAHTTSESMQLHFSQFGPCDAVVMMDRSTGRSRGFGFCTFGSMESLDAALAVPQVIDGKVADCKPCLPKEQAPPGLQPREFGSKGIGRGAAERVPLLEQNSADSAYMGQTQTTLESQVAELEAQAAMFAEETAAPGEIYGEEMFEQQETELAPWPHEVESMPASIGQGTASQSTHPAQPNKLFVGGLSQMTTKASLEAYFSQFGACEAVVMMDRNTGRSRGFGFCTFAEPEAAQAAAEEPLQHIVDGKPVECKFAALPSSGGMIATQASHAPQGLGGSIMPGSSVGTYGKGGRPAVQHAQQGAHPTANVDLSSNRVFIGGLPQSCDDAKLEAIFANFGSVIDAKVMMDRETQRSRGFGYISYTSAESVDAAISVSGQIAVDGKVVEVKHCQARHNGLGGAALSGHSGMMTGATPMRQSPASQQDLATQAIQLTQLLIDPALGLQDLIGPLLEQLQTAAAAIKSGASPTAAAAALKGFGVNPSASASAARGFRQGPPRWAPY